MLPLVYTLATGAAFTYHDNSNLMGRKLGLRVRQPHGLATDVGAAGFFGLEARGNGSEDVFMYVSEKMHLPPYSSLLRNALPRAFLSGAADLPERGRQAKPCTLSVTLFLTVTLLRTLTLFLNLTLFLALTYPQPQPEH